MPNQQINSITSATTTDGSELLPVVSGGVTKSVSVSTINSGIAADAVSDVYEARDLAVGQSSIAAAAALAAGSIAQQDLTAVSAALHRSPNAVTSMFVYDTTKDSDGGAWTEKCQHTSWYNETLSGKWLGAQVSELYARNVGASYGANVLANSDFSVDASGFETILGATITAENGLGKLTSVSGTQYAGVLANFSNPAGVVLNALYEVSVDVYPGTYTGVVDLAFDAANAADLKAEILSSGATRYTSTIYLTVASNSSNGRRMRVRFNSTHSAGQFVYIDNLSFKQVVSRVTASNDYYQSTTDGKFYRLWKNLYKYSQQFDISPWVTNNTATVSANVATAPDGTQTADALYETTTTSSHYVMQDAPVIAGLQYTVQFRVAPNGRTRVAIAGISSIGGGIGAGIFFELIGVGSVIGTPDGTATIKQDAAGFYLISYTWTAANTGAYSLGVFLVDSGTQTSYTGDPTKGVYLWGAQFEQNSTATSYELKTVDGTISEVFRGNKREFPKISAFIFEDRSLSIYDVTEPNCPMWMRFNFTYNSGSIYNSPYNWINGPGNISKTISHGVFANGMSDGGGGYFTVTNFASDFIYRYSGYGVQSVGGIANRHKYSGFYQVSPTGSASNNRSYGVAVVGPKRYLQNNDGYFSPVVVNFNNAAIDVVRENGKNFSIALSGYGGGAIAISPRGVLFETNTGIKFLTNLDTVTAGSTSYTSIGSLWPSFFIGGNSAYAPVVKNTFLRTNGTASVNIGVLNEVSIPKSIAATVTNTYNTGHMVGDIRRTYLADTAVGSVYSPALTMQNMITTAQQGVWYDPSDINLTWRRNLLTYSEQFDNAAWVKPNATVTANAAVAPDGTSTADFLVPNTTATSHFVGQAVSASANSTLSFYAKAGAYTRAVVATNANNFIYFDLSTGVVESSLGTGWSSASIVSAGNGWYRCIATSSLACTNAYIYAYNAAQTNGNVAPSFVGNGTSGIYIWGAQLEQGSTATPYQRITDGVQDYLQYQSQPVLYRDAAGTTPVTGVEQPVGLMLDKSKGLVLGPELVTNGDFSNGTTGWTAGAAGSAVTLSVVNQRLRLTKTNTASFGDAVQQVTGLTATKHYRISVNGYVGTAQVRFLLGVSPETGEVYSGVQSATDIAPVFYVTGRTSFWITVLAYGGDGTYAEFDNISVRELPGNHAFNSSGNSEKFPVLSARYNLLTKTEDFSDAVWTKAGGTNYANSTTAPDGTQTGALFIENTASGTHGYWQATSSIPSGVSAKYTIRLKYHSRRYVRVAWVTGGGAESVYVDVDLIAGVVVNQGPYGVSTTQTSASITSAGSGWYTVEIKGTLPSATTYATVYARNSSTNSNPESAFGYVGDGASGFYVWGADLRVSNDALNQPAYQRVNTATDYDTVGFKPYLRFNGTNQWLQTNSIDFTYTDKMFVSAGVRKLSGSLPALAAELSVNANDNNGSFYVAAPVRQFSVNDDYAFQAKGTSLATAISPVLSSPRTDILSAIGNISGDQSILRVNGTQAAISTSDQGTGNYGNYPLYIGARAGSSLWFNGRLYQLVIVNKIPTADELKSTETTINRKTLAYAEQ